MITSFGPMPRRLLIPTVVTYYYVPNSNTVDAARVRENRVLGELRESWELRDLEALLARSRIISRKFPSVHRFCFVRNARKGYKALIRKHVCLIIYNILYIYAFAIIQINVYFIIHSCIILVLEWKKMKLIFCKRNFGDRYFTVVLMIYIAS